MNVSMKVIRARLGHNHLQVLVVRINPMIAPVTCVHECEEQPGLFNKSGQSHSLIAAVWMAACRVRGPRSGLAAVPGLTLPRPGRTGAATARTVQGFDKGRGPVGLPADRAGLPPARRARSGSSRGFPCQIPERARSPPAVYRRESAAAKPPPSEFSGPRSGLVTVTGTHYAVSGSNKASPSLPPSRKTNRSRSPRSWARP